MQAMSPYPGLEAWMWRSLLARAAVFYATRTRLSQFCDHIDKGGAVEFVLRDLELRRGEWATSDVDDDAAVTRVVEAWDAQLAETLGLQQLDADGPAADPGAAGARPLRARPRPLPPDLRRDHRARQRPVRRRLAHPDARGGPHPPASAR